MKSFLNIIFTLLLICYASSSTKTNNNMKLRQNTATCEGLSAKTSNLRNYLGQLDFIYNTFQSHRELYDGLYQTNTDEAGDPTTKEELTEQDNQAVNGYLYMLDRIRTLVNQMIAQLENSEVCKAKLQTLSDRVVNRMSEVTEKVVPTA